MTVAAAQIIVAREEPAYYRRAVDLFVMAVRKADNPSVALSGGSTPKKLFQMLAAPENRSQVAWDRVNFFWGDERCVPPEHADSNFRMAQESLLSQVPVSQAHVHHFLITVERSSDRCSGIESNSSNSPLTDASVRC